MWSPSASSYFLTNTSIPSIKPRYQAYSYQLNNTRCFPRQRHGWYVMDEIWALTGINANSMYRLARAVSTTFVSQSPSMTARASTSTRLLLSPRGVRTRLSVSPHSQQNQRNQAWRTTEAFWPSGVTVSMIRLSSTTTFMTQSGMYWSRLLLRNLLMLTDS